jgi:two-component system osmolarity sensor histidine kinase EnvZ
VQHLDAGMLAGQEAAMLRAFARGDPSRGRPGSGLGLSIVAQIVIRLAGTLVFIHDEHGHHAIARFDRKARGLSDQGPVQPA